MYINILSMRNVSLKFQAGIAVVFTTTIILLFFGVYRFKTKQISLPALWFFHFFFFLYWSWHQITVFRCCKDFSWAHSRRRYNFSGLFIPSLFMCLLSERSFGLTDVKDPQRINISMKDQIDILRTWLLNIFYLFASSMRSFINAYLYPNCFLKMLTWSGRLILL